MEHGAFGASLTPPCVQASVVGLTRSVWQQACLSLRAVVRIGQRKDWQAALRSCWMTTMLAATKRYKIHHRLAPFGTAMQATAGVKLALRAFDHPTFPAVFGSRGTG